MTKSLVVGCFLLLELVKFFFFPNTISIFVNNFRRCASFNAPLHFVFQFRLWAFSSFQQEVDAFFSSFDRGEGLL